MGGTSGNVDSGYGVDGCGAVVGDSGRCLVMAAAAVVM